MNLDFKTLTETAEKREKEWPLNGMDNVARILFRSNELGGEAGELQNQVKKYVRHLADMRGPDADMEKISEEIGDVIISAVLLAIELELDPSKCVVDKFNKTSDKYNIDIKLVPTYSVSDLYNELGHITTDTKVKAAADYVEKNIEFPPTITNHSIVLYYEKIDAELAEFFDCDYEDIEEEILLRVKEELITRNNGMFFGAENAYEALELIQNNLNENDLYKVVNDPVTDNSNYYGYIGFRWEE